MSTTRQAICKATYNESSLLTTWNKSMQLHINLDCVAQVSKTTMLQSQKDVKC